MPPVVRVAVATLAGAFGGLAVFGGGWFLFAGSAPPLLGWAVGGVIAAFLGSETGCRTAIAFTPNAPPSADQPPHPSLAPSPPDGEPPHPESRWRDRMRAEAPLHTPYRR